MRCEGLGVWGVGGWGRGGGGRGARKITPSMCGTLRVKRGYKHKQSPNPIATHANVHVVVAERSGANDLKLSSYM